MNQPEVSTRDDLKHIIEKINEILINLPSPFNKATKKQVLFYSKNLLELKLEYAAKAQTGSNITNRDIERKVLPAFASLRKIFIPKQNSKEFKALVEVAEQWAAEHYAAEAKKAKISDQKYFKAVKEQRNLGKRGAISLPKRYRAEPLPAGFDPSLNPDGDLDFAATAFVKQFFTMASVIKEITPKAEKSVLKQNAHKDRELLIELVGVILPNLIETTFGKRIKVTSGEAGHPQKSSKQVLMDRVGYKIIEPSLRLIGWHPKNGKQWHPETLATLSKSAKTIT